jgi:hypothetical protein
MSLSREEADAWTGAATGSVLELIVSESEPV